ncbi:hypothetical protein LEP1GSC172_3933 [Leptospira noguchii]|uniref:Uncharacterized protein n=1 Tax=Leptospira noguchii TaxID=28182 RepID=M6VQ96_9LEPT|nr:hypothetical protein LEP1GSC172_3933 [Leptospira noguchii]
MEFFNNSNKKNFGKKLLIKEDETKILSCYDLPSLLKRDFR